MITAGISAVRPEPPTGCELLAEAAQDADGESRHHEVDPDVAPLGEDEVDHQPATTGQHQSCLGQM